MKQTDLVGCVLGALALAACGSDGNQSTAGTGGMTGASSSSGSSSGPGTGGAASASSSSAGQGGMGGFTTIFTILFENHDYNEIVGSADAPYFNSLIAMGGLATNYMDSGTHPSLPNYLYLISGDTQYLGFIDLDPTFFPFPKDADNLGNQMEMAGIKWRSYQESMGTACRLDGVGDYAPKHDPFLYFTNIQKGANGLCAATNVDYTEFPADLASGAYRYMWITPNLTSDGHDPSNDPSAALKQSDAWLMAELPKILNSDAYKQGGVIFITWDEAAGRNGNSADQVPMIILSPRLKSPGSESATAFSHASYLATIEEIYGLPKLAAAAKATSLMEFFAP